MNKQIFIERLNLFLDEELSDDESKELLAVVRDNPEYHRIYVQYCQLFNACTQLGDKFTPTKSMGNWRQKVYAVGGMAAAAALLLMAARNLSPMIGGSTDQLVSDAPQTQSVNSRNEVSLQVASLKSVSNGTDKKSDVIAADFQSYFKLNAEQLRFNVESDVTFDGYPVSSARVTNRDKVLAKSGFKLESGLEISTFDHEIHSAGDEVDPLYSVGPASFEGESADADDLSGAAAVQPRK